MHIILILKSYNFRYLLNPYSVISCASHSTAVVDNLAVACSLWAGLTGRRGYMYMTIMHILYLGNSILSALCLSMATYHSLYPVMLLVPLSLLLYQVGGAAV